MTKRKLCLALLILAAAVWECGLAAEIPKSLVPLLEQKAQFALELTKPIKQCVTEIDTNHPVFHGCIDWHSSVHGIWALIAYTHATGDCRFEPLLVHLLDPERLERERRWLADHPDFEMPYGRAWFLRLALEHIRHYRSDLLRPLADLVAESLVKRYRNAPPDPFSREYDSDSWALINLLDYARETSNRRTVVFVEDLVRRHFLRLDNSCEKIESRPDFMAVCTNAYWLVAKVLPHDDFVTWFRPQRATVLRLVPVTTPRSAHEYGKNFSRTWGLWGLYMATGDAQIADAYAQHFMATYSHRDHWAGDYRTVAHWVAQFGLFGLQPLFDPR